jgi:hypothetical protein
MTINATPKTDETIENNQGIQDSTTTAKQQYAEHLAEIFGESVVFIQDTETENNEKVIPQ